MILNLVLFLGGITAAAYGAKGLARDIRKKAQVSNAPPPEKIPSFAPEPQPK